MLWGVVALVKVEAKLFSFESKLLVEDHGWIVNGDMKSDVFATAALNEMVEHDTTNASPLEVRMDKEKRDVSFVDFDIRSHKGTSNQQLPIKYHTREVWALQTLTQVHWPEEL